jgi:peptidoglycan/xylan/chitin deacetylase (PgdA/CDA1 family)
MSDKLLHRCYYALKPMLPKRFRYALRRIDAQRKRSRISNSWPILPGSELPPPDWPGWPQGRQFAFVLTHDVEGRLGIDRCRQLMELEAKHGFRSSFNLVPEGEYRVNRALRDEMVQRGFEVGIHDLHHDGSLFRNYQQFYDQSVRINEYLREWNAVGFRAGFMFHNLKWQHLLNIRYDLSTFDTDPFEPQPDGMKTIFPFWVEHSSGHGGYLEMPYTMVQDSTLFLFLQEKTIAVWKQKLDWVAEHGGMALLNLHPDYISFDGISKKRSEFPCSYYGELLQYVRENYAGAFWNALPRELAETFEANRVVRSSNHRLGQQLERQPKEVS